MSAWASQCVRSVSFVRNAYASKSAASTSTPHLHRQSASATPSLDDAQVDGRLGTRIEGARVTDALPVVVVGQDKIDAIGAVSGDELIRNIPQMGDVSFNPGNNAQTSNAARGDVGSINLRSLGVGNTLVLLNGRRVVITTDITTAARRPIDFAYGVLKQLVQAAATAPMAGEWPRSAEALAHVAGVGGARALVQIWPRRSWRAKGGREQREQRGGSTAGRG